MLIPIIVSIFVAIAVIVITTKNRHDKVKNEVKSEIPESPPVVNYIAPKDFSVGVVKGDPPSSSLCDHNILYPINGLGPDYGFKPLPENCACTEFVQSP